MVILQYRASREATHTPLRIDCRWPRKGYICHQCRREFLRPTQRIRDLGAVSQYAQTRDNYRATVLAGFQAVEDECGVATCLEPNPCIPINQSRDIKRPMGSNWMNMPTAL